MSSTGPARRQDVSNFSRTLLDVLDRVEYRRVSLDDPTDPVFRLRYEAYRREQFIAPNSDRIATDRYDNSSNAMGYGVYIDGVLVSSLRLHHVTADERTSPSRSIYPDTLGAMLDRGESYIDPSRFTTDHDASLAYPALPYLTLRVAVMASIHFDADWCLSSVRPEHAAFYRRVFGSEQLDGDRYYDGLNFPVRLYAAPVKRIRERVFTRFPFFLSTPFERRALFSGSRTAVLPVRASARDAAHTDARIDA